jgi:hypothetical protein
MNSGVVFLKSVINWRRTAQPYGLMFASCSGTPTKGWGSKIKEKFSFPHHWTQVVFPFDAT